MAKKDTYLALLRRGIDENTAQLLADSGIKVGDLKKLDEEKLRNNYGLKKEIAKSVLEAVKSGPRAAAKQRYLADVLSKDQKKKVDKSRSNASSVSRRISLQNLTRRKRNYA